MGYIYCITNKLNEKKYVGKTTNSVDSRWKEHCSDCFKDRCNKRPLYDAMVKYGIENFSVETLEECHEDFLSDLELFWINKLDTYNSGYNATLGGDGSILFDYDEIERVYRKGGSMKQTAKEIGCCEDTVSKVVYLRNIPINKVYSNVIYKPKKVNMLNLNKEFIMSFESYSDAGKWLVENKFAKTYNGGVRQKIGMCVSGKLKTAYKHIWTSC